MRIENHFVGIRANEEDDLPAGIWAGGHLPAKDWAERSASCAMRVGISPDSMSIIPSCVTGAAFDGVLMVSTLLSLFEQHACVRRHSCRLRTQLCS
jgi:hypothetical protein